MAANIQCTSTISIEIRKKKKIGAFPSVKMNLAITCRNKGCGQSFIRRNHKRGLVLCKDVNGELLIDRLCLVLITLQ